MATITLRKSKFDNIKNVLDKLGANFNNYQSCLNELKNTAEGVDSSTCNLQDTIGKIDNSSESQADKVKKIKELNEKIEKFVNMAVRKEQAAKEEIVRKKKDFYKQYKNLKPDCEKNFFQRGIENYFKALKSTFDFIMEHLDIIITIYLIIAAIVIAIFCPASVIAIIGIIAGVISTIMDIADMTCMIMNDGKGISETLSDHGMDTLAKIWGGTSNGMMIASIILPAGAGLKFTSATSTKALKLSMKGSMKSIGKSIKEGIKNKALLTWESFKNFGKQLAEKPVKTLFSKFGDITGITDIFESKKNISTLLELSKSEKYSNGLCKIMRKETFDSVSIYEFKYDGDELLKRLDDKLKIYKKSGEIKKRDDLDESVRKIMQTQILDEIRIDNAFKDEFMQKTGVNTYLKGKKGFLTQEQFYDELSRNGLTLHEDFERNIIQVVPTEYHQILNHNGGTVVNLNRILDYKDIQLVSKGKTLNGPEFILKNEGKDIINDYKNNFINVIKNPKITGIVKAIENKIQNATYSTIAWEGDKIKSAITGD